MQSALGLIALPLVLVTACGGASNPSSLPTGRAPASPAPSATAPTPANGASAQKPVPAENNPPGDIPDNVAYVPYTNAAGRYAFTHPEGWSETTRGSAVTFTDKLNGVQGLLGNDTAAPTVELAKRRDVPALTSSQAAFELRSVTSVTVPGGSGVLIVYRRNSAPDPVTGRQYRDEVQRYELVHAGREVVLELFGPVGADNVDAYHRMIQSLKIS